MTMQRQGVEHLTVDDVPAPEHDTLEVASVVDGGAQLVVRLVEPAHAVVLRLIRRSHAPDGLAKLLQDNGFACVICAFLVHAPCTLTNRAPEKK